MRRVRNMFSTMSEIVPVPAGRTAARRTRRMGSLVRQGRPMILLLVLGLASYITISHFVLQSVEVIGVSMVPTLRHADHYFLNRFVYYVRPPRRNDVVVIKDPVDGTYAVKRIIAVAGESVHFKRGRVYVNGEALNEPYLQRGTRTFPATKPEELITCGADRYFVMGDNRSNSLDSREYGPVPRQNILGVIIR